MHTPSASPNPRWETAPLTSTPSGVPTTALPHSTSAVRRVRGSRNCPERV